VLPEVDGGIFMVNLRDTIGHFGAYVCLAGLMVLETHKFNLSKLKKVLACILTPILFSGIVELLQEYCTYTRAAEWSDMLCNSCGTLVGFFFATLLLKYLPKRFLKYFSKLF
jgi:VanZ family protein